MKAKICKCCGAEFVPRYKQQNCCSDECRERQRQKLKHGRDAEYKSDFASAWKAASIVPADRIQRARRKPEGVSDVRWRIELRRRADPERFASANI